MVRRHWPAGVAILVVLIAVTACSGTGVTPVATQATPGTVSPSGPVQVGTWMLTVHSAQAYPHSWNAPTGMPGRWGNMGSGYMAVVLDISAQTGTTPTADTGVSYAGPQCALRSGWGMMGTMMGNGAYG